ELYNNALTTIDELAERVLTLGKSPYSTFANYLKEADLKEVDTIGMKDTDMVKAIISDLESLIAMQRTLLEVTSTAGDEGTNDMINAHMQFNEKQHWMMKSFVK